MFNVLYKSSRCKKEESHRTKPERKIYTAKNTILCNADFDFSSICCHHRWCWGTVCVAAPTGKAPTNPKTKWFHLKRVIHIWSAVHTKSLVDVSRWWLNLILFSSYEHVYLFKRYCTSSYGFFLRMYEIIMRNYAIKYTKTIQSSPRSTNKNIPKTYNFGTASCKIEVENGSKFLSEI